MFKVTKKQLEEARHEWEYKDGDNFTAILFELIRKADYINFRKLAKVYPAETYVHAEHYHPYLIAVGGSEQIFEIVEE
ncbi:hypothetical protein ACQH7H_23725 [Escherichia coli]|uniref:hypothetical protein n=1 Tax=Escherichia coli TaxID=562 RepID=UPI003CEFD900